MESAGGSGPDVLALNLESEEGESLSTSGLCGAWLQYLEWQKHLESMKEATAL